MPDDGYEIRPSCRLHKVRQCFHILRKSALSPGVGYERYRFATWRTISIGVNGILLHRVARRTVRSLESSGFAANGMVLADHGKFKVNAVFGNLTWAYGSFTSAIVRGARKVGRRSGERLRPATLKNFVKLRAYKRFLTVWQPHPLDSDKP